MMSLLMKSWEKICYLNKHKTLTVVTRKTSHSRKLHNVYKVHKEGAARCIQGSITLAFILNIREL